MQRSSSRRLPALLLSVSSAFALNFLPVLAHAQNAPAAKPATPCTVEQTAPTEGDLAIARTDFDAALAFYRAALAKDPSSLEANLGLVRALVGKNQTSEAKQQAEAVLAKAPHSALAEVAAGEAAYRAADFLGAREHARLALADDHCEARAMDLAASLFEVTAMFASEAQYLQVAHRLRPNDELILRDWIGSLPAKQRQAELQKYLQGTNALSKKDRTNFTNEEDHLKARRPGECRISSASETVKIPFEPIYGDSPVPVAYGLDVSFNGKKRRMQIDTGASGIVLSSGAARRLDLKPEYRLHTSGVGDDGEVESYITHVEKIQIGDVQVSDCMVEVLGKTKLDVDGLIGLDVFRRWLATLDYPNRQLLLSPLPPREAGPATQQNLAEKEDPDNVAPKDAIVPPQMKDWLHVVRIGHEILLPAMINNGALHYMMADTGASKSVLSLGFAQETGKTRRADEVTFSGVSGEVKKVYVVENTNLRFGQLQLPSGSYYAIDITNVSHNTGAEVSGFIGLSTLSRLTVTIDYRDNLMLLKYDRNKDRIVF